MDRNTFAESIEAWSETVGADLLRVLSPIYREERDEVVLIGSGVLLRVGTQVFLVSAAHVGDLTSDGIYYFGTEELVRLPNGKIQSPMPASGDRMDDQIDLVFWPLDPAAQSLVRANDTLPLERLDPFDPEGIAPGTRYFLNGYPCSRQRRKFTPEDFQARTLAFLTEERPPSEYDQVGRKRDSTLFVSYDKKDFHSFGGVTLGPDLFGVSGGAVWRVEGEAASMQMPLLSAIVTTWRKSSPTGVISTRIRVWLDAIAVHFPTLLVAALDDLR